MHYFEIPVVTNRLYIASGGLVAFDDIRSQLTPARDASRRDVRVLVFVFDKYAGRRTNTDWTYKPALSSFPLHPPPHGRVPPSVV